MATARMRPQQTSNVSQAQAEAKQKALAKEKQQQDAHQQRHRRDRLRASEPRNSGTPPQRLPSANETAAGTQLGNDRAAPMRPSRQPRADAAQQRIGKGRSDGPL